MCLWAEGWERGEIQVLSRPLLIDYHGNYICAMQIDFHAFCSHIVDKFN